MFRAETIMSVFIAMTSYPEELSKHI